MAFTFPNFNINSDEELFQDCLLKILNFVSKENFQKYSRDKLKEIQESFLNLFTWCGIKYEVQKLKITKYPFLEDLLAALLSVFIDINLLQFGNLDNKKRKKRISKDLCWKVFYILFDFQQYSLDVLLQLQHVNQLSIEILLPLIRKCLDLHAKQSKNNEVFTKVIVLLKRICSISPKIFNEQYIASLNLVTPPDYLKWIKFKSKKVGREMKNILLENNCDLKYLTKGLLEFASNEFMDNLLEIFDEYPQKEPEETDMDIEEHLDFIIDKKGSESIKVEVDNIARLANNIIDKNHIEYEKNNTIPSWSSPIKVDSIINKGNMDSSCKILEQINEMNIIQNNIKTNVSDYLSPVCQDKVTIVDSSILESTGYEKIKDSCSHKIICSVFNTNKNNKLNEGNVLESNIQEIYEDFNSHEVDQIKSDTDIIKYIELNVTSGSKPEIISDCLQLKENSIIQLNNDEVEEQKITNSQLSINDTNVDQSNILNNDSNVFNSVCNEYRNKSFLENSELFEVEKDVNNTNEIKSNLNVIESTNAQNIFGLGATSGEKFLISVLNCDFFNNEKSDTSYNELTEETSQNERGCGSDFTNDIQPSLDLIEETLNAITSKNEYLDLINDTKDIFYQNISIAHTENDNDHNSDNFLEINESDSFVSDIAFAKNNFTVVKDIDKQSCITEVSLKPLKNFFQLNNRLSLSPRKIANTKRTDKITKNKSLPLDKKNELSSFDIDPFIKEENKYLTQLNEFKSNNKKGKRKLCSQSDYGKTDESTYYNLRKRTSTIKDSVYEDSIKKNSFKIFKENSNVLKKGIILTNVRRSSRLATWN